MRGRSLYQGPSAKYKDAQHVGGLWNVLFWLTLPCKAFAWQFWLERSIGMKAPQQVQGVVKCPDTWRGPEDPKALRGLAVLGQSIVGVGGSVSEKCQKEKESADTGIWSKALAPYADRSSLTKTQLLLCYSGHSRLIMEHQNILGWNDSK